MENVTNTPLNEEKKANVKPHWLMRVAGALIDGCLIFLATFGLYNLCGLTPLADGINSYNEQIASIQDTYKLDKLVEGSEETVGYKLHYFEEGYDKANGYVHSDVYGNYKVVNNANISENVATAYKTALNNDVEYKNATFNHRLCDFGLIALCGSVSELILLLLIPMLNSRRATLGKLAAGTQLISYKIEGKAKWYQLLGRTIYTIIVESLLPYLFLASLTAIVIPAIMMIFVLANKKGRTIRDMLSGTMVIDKRSYAPLIEPKDLK